MNISYSCSVCQKEVQLTIKPDLRVLQCPGCGHSLQVPDGALNRGKLERCVACPSTDLFIRKDFPQRLGVGIVAAGFLASSIAWAYWQPLWSYAFLFATALIDLVLYAIVPNALMCYGCGAQYRFVPGIDRFEPFDLETHERHRQLQARLAEQSKA